jgi:pimeloyl-ACP methyl ester carboxylesterase
MTTSQFPARFYPLPHTQRHLAYSEVGDASSTHVLLCLPGLLETRASFDALLQSAQGVRGLRVISVEQCGRGDSSPLLRDEGYAMSVYLADTLAFINQVVLREGGPVTRLEVMGTSMGGILAMYLAHELGSRVAGLFFNDIGLSLHWMSIYGLYDGMKVQGRLPEPEALAAQLNVSLGAVHAVQLPAHFDLPYRKDWKGMKCLFASFMVARQAFVPRSKCVRCSKSLRNVRCSKWPVPLTLRRSRPRCVSLCCRR